MRRTAGLALPLLLLTGCTTTVQGVASPGPVPAHSAGAASAAPALPGGASPPSCARLVDDGCGDDTEGSPTRNGLVSCSSLPAAVQTFDEAASAVFPGWQDGDGTAEQTRALRDVVAGVVDSCGYQVMIDVADQYADPASYDLLVEANVALGHLLLEPEGLRCADLQARGYSAKDAVDYWFVWGAPDAMDADLNGVPCETVFPDVARYMPPYY